MVNREPVTPDNWEDNSAELMSFARKKLQKRGLKLGDVVVHDWNEDLAHQVMDIVGDMATIGVPDHPELTKTVPVSSLFDPNDVMSRVKGMMFEDQNPDINN